MTFLLQLAQLLALAIAIAFLFSLINSLSILNRTLRKNMSALDNLTAIVPKLQSDAAAKLAAKDATIAALKDQLAAFQNDEATINGVVDILTQVDGTMQPDAPAA